jgi:hypothetical protein
MHFLFPLGSKSKVASNASNQPSTLPVKTEPGVSLLSFARFLLVFFTPLDHFYALVSDGCYRQKEKWCPNCRSFEKA